MLTAVQYKRRDGFFMNPVKVGNVGTGKMQGGENVGMNKKGATGRTERE